MAAFRNYILCFALVAGTIAGPINIPDVNDVKCATTCTESLSENAKFQYIPGNTYRYKYEGTTETKIEGPSDQSTGLKIDATVNIEVLSQCEFALKLQDVSLSENGAASLGSRQFQQQLEARPLRFAFQDGKIEQVCSASGEDERVLNIKRGILSTFQNSMEKLDKNGQFTETDISGTCPTTYESKSGIFSGLTITKTKDILACVDRNGNVSSIHSKRYMVPSKIQSLPLLKSTLVCEQDISSSRIEKTVCTEELMFRPFSQEKNGAITKATQSLTYQSKTSSISTSQSPIERRSSLLFHHVYDDSIDADAKAEVISTLQKICSEVSDDITKDTPILFGTLVSHMKRLSTDKMMEVYTAVNGARICSSQRGKQFFFDAVPMVATEASLSMMQKLISEKVIEGSEAEMWLTQLAFIPRPNYQMLTVIKPLLSDETFKKQALLGVSAMVHKLCDNQPDCAQHSEVRDFIRLLESNLGRDCTSTTDEQRNLILITLKAFGNAGDAITSNSVLNRCVNNNDLDMEVRIATLQAFRRMPCSISHEDPMRLYQNAENDAELRIHAFLAVMSCPTSDVLTKVRMMLSGEPVNQVGSFVWTYLENLKETSVPLKQDLATILEDAKLREDFNIDVRKFSRNMEKSLFSEYLNIGAQIESNLIWSQRSYIPRSAMVNVSVEMFGNSINLIEMGGRVQGLEKIVEKFFGPEGYFSKKRTTELMESKRQTANYISPFDSMFKTPEDKITTSMYTKVFGNEIMFQELTSDDWAELQDFNIFDFLIGLAEPKKIDVTRNYQFLDSSLIVPTCVGLPLNLTVNGSASVSLDVDGNIDLRNFAASPRNLDINGHIKPSAAIVVSGLMGVDAFVTKSSMKMVATMHTSTMIDGKIQLKDGEVFTVELNTPQEKMEIFHMQTEFFMNGEEMTMPEPAVEFKKCTPAAATRVIGMEMCVDATLPSSGSRYLPLPPFTGPMNVQAFIEKKDTHTSYKFTAELKNERSQVSGTTYTKRTFHVSVNTPDSQVDRQLLAEAIFDPAAMSASAQLMTPWKKFSWTSSLENEATNKRALAVMKIDETQEYSFDAQLGVEEKSAKTVYTPALTITVPNRPTMTMTGSFEMGTGKSILAADIRLRRFTRKDITFTTAVTQNGDSYNFDMNLDSDYLTSKVESSLSISPKTYNGRASLEYSLNGRPNHRFTASGKFSDNSVGDLINYSVQAGLVPTEFPQYGFSVDGNWQSTSDHVNTDVTIEWDSDKKLSVAHKTTKQGDWNALTITSESSLKYPNNNVDLAMNVDHEHKKDFLKSSVLVTYAPSKTVSAAVELDKRVADSYKGDFSLSYPGREMSLETSTNKIGDEYKMVVDAKWNSDADSQMTMTSSWKNGETHEISSEIEFPGHPVSLKITFKPVLTDFMGEVDLTYQGQNYLASSSYQLSDDSLMSSVSWTCPYCSVTYQMSGTMNEKTLSYDAELKWEADKMVKVSGVYNNKDSANIKREGNIRVASPWVTFTTSSNFEKTGETAGTFNWELVHGDEKCQVSARVSDSNGEVTLSSPYIQYGQIKSLRASYNIYQNSAEADFSWSPTQKISTTAAWTDSKYELEATTPFEYYRNAKLVVRPPTTLTPFEASLEVDSNRMSTSLDYPAFKTGEFSYTFGENTATAKFNQNGRIDTFQGDAELTWNSQKLWGKLNVNTQGPYTLELDVTTPFEIEKFSANLHHEGEPLDFITRAAFTWDNEEMQSTLRFRGTNAQLTVASPWKDIEASYEVSGELKAFNAESMLKWGEGKQIKATAKFDMKVQGLKSSFSLESPFYNTISGDVDYRGELQDHSGTATLTWASDKSIKLTEKFSMVNGLTYEGKLENPWTQTVTVNVEHSGSLKSWTQSVSYTMGYDTPVNYYAQFDITRDYSLKFGIKNSPYQYLPNYDAVLEYKTTNYKNEALASLTYAQGDISLRGSLEKQNGYKVTAVLVTPFTEQYSLEVNHSGDIKSFENTIKVQWDPIKKIDMVTSLDTRSGFDGKVRLNSPWRVMSFSAKKLGNDNEFTASTSLSWESGKEITSSLEFSKLSEIKATWSLKTPFEKVSDVSAVFTHRGDSYDQFYSQFDGKLNQKEFRLAVDWDMTSDVELKLNCVNPWKNFNVNAKYAGEPKDFTVTTAFVLDQDNYSASMKFAWKSGLEMELDINPVVIQPIKAKVSADGSSNTASVTWGDNKTISAEATYTTNSFDKSKEVEVSFNTPFEGYENGEAKVKHTGTMEAFRETAEVSFYNKKASLEFGFTSFGEYRGDFDISSPWYNANGRFSHSGNLEKFDNDMELTYASGKTIRSETNWSMENGVSADWSLTSPFKNMNAKWSHEVESTASGKAHAEFSWDDTNQIISDMTFTNKPGDIKVEFTFTSPWKSVATKYTHRGTISTRCNSEAEFGWDSQKQFTANWSISRLNGLSVEATVVTPWKTVSGEVEHQGTMADFTNKISITYDSETIALESEFKMEPDLFVKSSLASPWTNASGSYRHSGTLDNFTCHLEGHVDSRPITGDLAWNMNNGVRTSFSVDTPWQKLSGEFGTNDDIKDLSADVKLDWGTGKIDGEITYKMVNGYEGSLTANTPWRNLHARFNGQGSRDDFEWNGEMKWATDSEITAKVSFANTDSSRNGEMTLNTPWKNLSANYRSSGTWPNLDSKVDFSWETDKTMSLEAKMNMESGFNTEWKMNSPWINLSADCQWNGSPESMSSSGNFQWDVNKKIGVEFSHTMSSGYMSTSATMNSPWKNLEFRYTRTGTWEKVSTTTEFSWEPTKKISTTVEYDLENGFDGKVTIETPWKNASGTAKFVGDVSSFDSSCTLVWDGQQFATSLVYSNSPMSATWSLTYPQYRMEATFKHDGTSTNMNSEASFMVNGKTWKVTTKFDRRSSYEGEVTVSTPEATYSADFSHTGELENFRNSANLSWAADKKMSFTSNFQMTDSTSGEFEFTSPFAEKISGKFSHRCSEKMFQTEGELSWAPTKNIEGSVSFSQDSAITGSASLKTPFYDDLEASFEHNGEIDNFSSKASFSWATDKKVEASASFSKGSPMTGALTLKTPFYEDLRANFEHSGEMTNFNNKASFSWATDKTVEGSVTFKYGENIEASASLKTPFYDEMKLEADLSKTVGDMTIELPQLERIKVQYRVTDFMNWNADAEYGNQKFVVTTSGSMANGFRFSSNVECPSCSFGVDIDHRGDYNTFTNSVEGKWNEYSLKLTTEFDMPNKKASQTLEVTGYERSTWSAEYRTTESTISGDMELTYGAQKLELDLNSGVQWTKDKAIVTSTLTVKTPFADYEENKLDATLEYSAKLFNLRLEGHKGSVANSKKLELYKMIQDTEFNAYVKTTLFGSGESVMSLDTVYANNKITIEVVNDLKFHETSKFTAKLVSEYKENGSGHSHEGSLEVSCHDGVRKLVWNAGSNSYMCETSLVFTKDSQELENFSHKTTWDTAYTKLSQEITFKSQYSGYEHWESKIAYDFTQTKKTAAVTMFNDPTAPYDLKAEWQMEDEVDMMMEFTSPWETVKLVKFDVSANVASQPWDVKAEGSFNDHTFTSEGRMEYDMEGKFDISMTFTSQIPNFENLQFTVSNTQMNGQYKPHVVVQWASDKRIEMSATFSWSSTYKINVDLNTPFDSLRSLVTDFTVNWNMPETMDMSFDFKTNKMSKNLSAQMEFNRASTSLTMKAESPFEMLSSFELTGTIQPRLTLVIKRNGETLINLNGSAQFDSWTSHSLDFTVTYPWWNQYMSVKVDNDLSLANDNSMSMDLEFEYMRSKKITFKYTHSKTPKANIHVSFTSPFEKFESIKYSLMYEGSLQNWTENTEFEYYCGKVTTSTSFSMANGIKYTQSVTGQMTHGHDNFNMENSFEFTGDRNQFDVEASMSGSFMPTVTYSTSWTYNPLKMSVKAVLNDYHFEYTHNGEWRDFTCNYLVRVPYSSLWYGDVTNEWKGNWSFKYTDRLSYTAQLTCPHSDVTLNVDLGMMDGRFTGTWKYDDETATWTTSYSRAESPFKYEGHAKLQASTNTVEIGVTVTKDSLTMPFHYNGEEVIGLYVSNQKNSDMEYEPSIKVVVQDEPYEFDGVYKNEGQGLVRDFKLHMTGPKGYDNYIKLQFELETQSSQLVPGDSKIYLSHMKKDGTERQILDMSSNWGNDRAVVTFAAPRPMSYSIDFSVDTTGQSGEINANWDTTANDKNFQMKFVNKFAASSQRVKSQIDIDVIYTGISRGFFSDLTWRTDSFAHKLSFDYNGKEIGYDLNVDHQSGNCDSSLELISEWRNVKAAWTNKPLSDGRELSFAFYWDSAKDESKKVGGVSRWERTAQNTYTWTTTFFHPALAKDFVITDVIAYDTSRYYFSASKTLSFSTDSSKDVMVKVELEKNGKWGVELKQDFNKIDMKIGTEFTQSGSKSHFIYRTTSGQTKTFGLESSYTDANNAVLVKLTTPMKTFELSSETTRTTWTGRLKVDSDVYEVAVTVRPEDTYMAVTLTCPHGNEYTFESTVIDKGYQIQLSRTESGASSIDALLALSMNDNRTLNGKLYWNPAVYSELKSKIAVVRTDVNDLMRRMYNSGSGEMTNKANSLQLGSDFDAIMPHYQSELSALQQDLDVATEKISQAYQQDVFYMKSIGQVLGTMAEELSEKFAVVEEKVMRFYDEVIEPNLPSLDAEKIRAQLMSKLAQVEERIGQLKYAVSERWADEIEKVTEVVEAVADYLQRLMDRVNTYVSEHPITEMLRNVHTSTMNKFNEVSDMAYNQVSGLTDPQVYADAIYDVHNYMSETLANSRLTDFISANTIRSMSDSLMYKLQYYYQYYDVADSLQMLIEHSRSVAADYLDSYLQHYIDEALSEFEWKQYDLENGRIEFEMSIPTRYSDIHAQLYNNVQFARIKADLRQRIEAIVDHMAKYHLNVKEMFYMYKPQSFDQILPPFNAQAIIAGQHIRTFDRRHYDFSSGSCSYLLARDFQDGNFTVFVNYDGRSQSLTVHSNGLVIDIAQDNTVKLDGSKVELPFQHFNTSVTRMGHYVTVSSTLGVEVVCDNEHGLCTVEMSGYYFAKTGGLFGTYNYEPLDDFTTSQNRNVSDVQEFASSWTSRCSGSNTAQKFEPVKDTKEYRACAAVFVDSASPMQSCFSVVDPMHAFHKCINDMSMNVSLTERNGPCKAAKFYQAECEFAGLTVDEPAQCVTCNMEQTTIAQYGQYQLPEPVMAADIVLVVEEKMCNENTDDKLPGLARLIDESLARNGYTDIRYGLVGFGGFGVHGPRHVHTMDSKMFASQRDLNLGTDALRFGDGENRDVLEAIDFAAQYPFRSGATKLIIVIPCSDCSSASLFSYRSLASRLVNEDITLHVLNEFSYDVTAEGKNPETNYIFGIDNSAVFSQRDSRSVRGNTNLYPITTKPTDSCSSLALETGGTVFDLNMMTKMRSTTSKNFQTVFANRIAMTTFPSSCTVCTCEYSDLFHMARSTCRRC